MAKPIEPKVADTILQKDKSIKIGNKIYTFAPPSSATLIEVSALIAKVPILDRKEKEPIKAMWHYAKDCEPVGEIVATMICGAKGLRGSKLAKILRQRKINRMTRRILEDLRPSELQELTLALLNEMEIEDFFVLTAFLSVINLTKAVKTEETETTAFGQQ